MDRIRRGLVPEQMEDKWFIYWKDDALFFHRSWTGYCVYIAHFAASGETWTMTRADVNRDQRQYTETNDESDARLVEYLIDALLLHKAVRWPGTSGPAGSSAITNWSSVGRGMFGQGPDDRDES